MKKLVYVSLALNILLLVTTVVCIVLFSKGHCGQDDEISTSVVKPANGSLAVAYVNVDSLIEHYLLVKDLQSGFDAQRVKMQQEFGAKQNKFESEVRDFQNRASSMSASDAERLEKSLGAKQQQLMALEQQYSNQLAEQEMNMKKHITDSLVNYLNSKYKNKYDYILGYTNGGGILYANDSYNITTVVLKNLNKQYSSNKEK